MGFVYCIFFLLLPIIFIPNPNHVFINHILMLNPMYYIVNGIAQSIIFGISSMENIPYHFYFILFLCLIAAVNFVLARYTTHAIYNKTSKVTNLIINRMFQMIVQTRRILLHDV